MRSYFTTFLTCSAVMLLILAILAVSEQARADSNGDYCYGQCGDDWSCFSDCCSVSCADPTYSSDCYKSCIATVPTGCQPNNACKKNCDFDLPNCFQGGTPCITNLLSCRACVCDFVPVGMGVECWCALPK
jgi:hypothetical protein